MVKGLKYMKTCQQVSALAWVSEAATVQQVVAFSVEVSVWW
jgi:hypothetical protein